MTDPPWLRVWLQGGEATGWDYFTLIEPDEVIYVMRSPRPEVAEWIRVNEDWPEALRYRRQPNVEQLSGERIYYPAP
jgi:hypothetical protein